MLTADVISFREFAMHEPLPLSTIQTAVLEFLQGRDDAVLFGAQAVNAYVDESRATQDVDIMSADAAELADELREYLSERFHIAVRVREIAGKGFRVYQTRKEGNRHLVDIRLQEPMPETNVIENVRVLTPAELIVSKVLSYDSRRGKPKSGTDWRDAAVLLRQFPHYKVADGEISQRLLDKDASATAMKSWQQLVEQDLTEDEDDDLNF